MLTPFDTNREVDTASCDRLIEFYLAGGSDGLFASCLSSEIYNLSVEEQIQLIHGVLKRVDGRVPVIASIAPQRGSFTHGDHLERYCDAVNQLTDSGLAAVVVLTNQLADEDESDSVIQQHAEQLFQRLSPTLRLGLYECPDPYKRLVSPEIMTWAVASERFYFLKDTCCDTAQIREKLACMGSGHFRLYNANTATLLESLQDGAHGYSGVMANYVPHLLSWLSHSFQSDLEAASELSAFLTELNSLVGISYPKGIKEHLYTRRIIDTYECRVDVQEHTDSIPLTYASAQKEINAWEERLSLSSPYKVI